MSVIHVLWIILVVAVCKVQAQPRRKAMLGRGGEGNSILFPVMMNMEMLDQYLNSGDIVRSSAGAGNRKYGLKTELLQSNQELLLDGEDPDDPLGLQLRADRKYGAAMKKRKYGLRTELQQNNQNRALSLDGEDPNDPFGPKADAERRKAAAVKKKYGLRHDLQHRNSQGMASGLDGLNGEDPEDTLGAQAKADRYYRSGAPASEIQSPADQLLKEPYREY